MRRHRRSRTHPDQNWLNLAGFLVTVAGVIVAILACFFQDSVSPIIRNLFATPTPTTPVAISVFIQSTSTPSPSNTSSPTHTPSNTSTLSPSPTPTFTPTETRTFTRTHTSAPTSTPSFTPLPTRTPRPCSYVGSNDFKTIENLVHAEAQAVDRSDISMIQVIFAKDAVIQNRAKEPPERWEDPVARYQQLFTEADFEEVDHTDIKHKPWDGSNGELFFTSASRGKFISGGTEYLYENPPDSDHWTFRKVRGCWVITKFDFNASHIPFPP